MTVVVITLAPLRFSPEPINPLSFAWRNFDVVMNVVMFIPLGFIYQLSRGRARSVAWTAALALGAFMSATVEAAQFFLPERYPSVVDLLTNTAGAGVGAWLAHTAFGSTDGAKAVRAFGVELPLMGLVYLLVPLAWLAALGSDSGSQAWIVVPVALSAGWIIAAVFRSFERAPYTRVVLAMGAWLFIALAPSALRTPRFAAIVAAGGVCAAFIRAVAPTILTHESQHGRASRRFEASTLNVVLPLLFLYLVASSITPAAVRADSWTGMVPLFPPRQSATNTVIFRALEHIASFTLIGYAIAEYFGRVRDRFATIAPVVLGVAAVASAGLEYIRGWHPLYGASALMFLLTLVGAGLGAWLYILQLAHVRALTGHGSRRM